MERSDKAFKLTDARVDYKGRLHLTVRTRDDGTYRSFVMEVESVEAAAAYEAVMGYDFSDGYSKLQRYKGAQTFLGAIKFSMRKPPIFSNRRPPRS